MPKRKEQLSQEDQSERFRREAKRLIDAGELAPAEAEAALDRLVRKATTKAS